MSEDLTSVAMKYEVESPTRIDFDKKVLIVEDQQEFRMMIAHHLAKLNFTTIVQKANGYEAVELLRAEGKVDLIICDFDMPSMSGLDLLTEIRNDVELDSAPFCLMMEEVSKEKLMLAVEHGADEILVKPFTFNDLGPKLASSFKKFHLPSNPEKVYELAKQELRAGNLDKAKDIYTDLAAAAPKAARPMVGLSRVAHRSGDNAKAIELLEQAEKRNKMFTHLYCDRGVLYAQEREWDKAIRGFRHAIDISPLNAIRYAQAAEVMFKADRHQEAAELLESALKRNIEFPDLYHYLSQAMFAQNKHDRAAQYIKRALAEDADNIKYLNQLGICLRETGEHEEAKRTYNYIIKLDPKNVSALYNKAVLFMGQRKFTDALKILERVRKLSPGFRAAEEKIGECERALDDMNAA